RGCVDESALANFKAGPSEERVMRGNKNFRHRARLYPVKYRRNRGKITLRHDYKLCLCAAADDSKNAVAYLPGANRVTNRFDFACKLHTRNILRIILRRGIVSAPLQRVGAIQSRCMHADANAISHWR